MTGMARVVLGVGQVREALGERLFAEVARRCLVATEGIGGRALRKAVGDDAVDLVAGMACAKALGGKLLEVDPDVTVEQDPEAWAKAVRDAASGPSRPPRRPSRP